MKHPSRSRTIVEFTDDEPVDDAAHKLRRMYINGTPVMVDADSIDIQFGHKELTKVTLTLIPAEIHFNSKESN